MRSPSWPVAALVSPTSVVADWPSTLCHGMCQLCLLGADSDVLVSILQHLPLRTKRLQLTYLCSCDQMRQSLLRPAAFAHDEVHIRTSGMAAQDIGASLAAIRVPSFLSHIRSLSATVSCGRQGYVYTSPQFVDSTDQSADSSSSVVLAKKKTSGKKNSKKALKQPKRPQQLPFIGLASLAHLHTLYICCYCNSQAAYEEQHTQLDRPTVALPLMPQLRVLIVSGKVTQHCLPLLLSAPQQCPQLSFVDLHDFRFSSSKQHGAPAADAKSFSPLLLPFMRWLASVNHTVRLKGELERCYLSLKQPPVERTPADRAIEYVQLAPSRADRVRPARTFPCQLLQASLCARLVSLQCREAANYEVPDFDSDFDSDMEDDTKENSVEEREEDREEEDSEEDSQEDKKENRSLNSDFMCFSPSAPCPFVALAFLWLPIGVTQSGRLSVRLARLRQLPALQALVLDVDIMPDPAVDEKKEDEDEKGASQQRADEDEDKDMRDDDESALAQLSSIRTLQRLAIRGGEYPWDEMHGVRRMSASVGLGFIAALFGWHVADSSTLRRSDCSGPTPTKLRIRSLTVHLNLSEGEEIDAVLDAVAYHVDPATCRELNCSVHMRGQDRGDIIHHNRALLVSALRLRHLLPLLRSPLSDPPLQLTVSPLSDSCAEAIDAYNERKRVEPAERPPAEQHSSPMMSQLSAASRGQPCWVDAARVWDVESEEYDETYGYEVRGRFSAACLAHITELPRTVKHVRR